MHPLSGLIYWLSILVFTLLAISIFFPIAMSLCPSLWELLWVLFMLLWLLPQLMGTIKEGLDLRACSTFPLSVLKWVTCSLALNASFFPVKTLTFVSRPRKIHESNSFLRLENSLLWNVSTHSTNIYQDHTTEVSTGDTMVPVFRDL